MWTRSFRSKRPGNSQFTFDPQKHRGKRISSLIFTNKKTRKNFSVLCYTNKIGFLLLRFLLYCRQTFIDFPTVYFLSKLYKTHRSSSIFILDLLWSKMELYLLIGYTLPFETVHYPEGCGFYKFLFV